LADRKAHGLEKAVPLITKAQTFSVSNKKTEGELANTGFTWKSAVKQR